VTSSPGRSLALGDKLVVSLATAKRLPSAKDSLLTLDARTSKAFSDVHMLLSIDSYGFSEGKSNRFQNKAADKISIFFPWIITN